MSELHERIARMITDSGLSLPKFAAIFGINKNTLIRYRDGVNAPPADFLQHLCTEFAVNPAWLLLDYGEAYAKDTARVITEASSEDKKSQTEKQEAEGNAVHLIPETGTLRLIETDRLKWSDKILDAAVLVAINAPDVIAKVDPPISLDRQKIIYSTLLRLLDSFDPKELTVLRDLIEIWIHSNLLEDE